MSSNNELKSRFEDHQKHNEKKASSYQTTAELLSVDEKLKILKARGQADLVEIFKDWKPRVASRRRKGAPLDQRVSIALSHAERAILDGEVRASKESGGASTTLGAIIRSRAMITPNMSEWRDIAWAALDELDEIQKSEKETNNRRKALELALEEVDYDDDSEEAVALTRELADLHARMNKLKSTPVEKRGVRLQGRMTYAEAEAIKWRAQRLCLSTADFLRMLIFDLKPNTAADAHLGLDARRRFYVSIIDVADNDWGSPPGVYKCSQCESYADEIARLQEQVRQLEAFRV